MAQINLDKLPLADLIDLQQRLGPLIEAARARERGLAREKLDKLAQSLGFTTRDLFGATRRRGPVKVKYVNPDDAAQTWTGRGRTPNWLRAKLDKGAKLESFLV